MGCSYGLAKNIAARQMLQLCVHIKLKEAFKKMEFVTVDRGGDVETSTSKVLVSCSD